MEYFKDIPGYEGRYQVSNHGRVFSLKTEKILKPIRCATGYLYAHLSNGGRAQKKVIHRLVMLTFCGRSLLTVNHKDFNRTNNHLDNLEYLSIGDNIRHSAATGRLSRPSTTRKIDSTDVQLIRASNDLPKDLARRFGVCRQTIRNIKLGLFYRDV